MGGTLRPNDPPKCLGPWTIIINESLIETLFSYISTIWLPNSSSLSIQNTPLRIATGRDKIISIDHLHDETKVIPIQVAKGIMVETFTSRIKQSNLQ